MRDSLAKVEINLDEVSLRREAVYLITFKKFGNSVAKDLTVAIDVGHDTETDQWDANVARSQRPQDLYPEGRARSEIHVFRGINEGLPQTIRFRFHFNYWDVDGIHQTPVTEYTYYNTHEIQPSKDM